MEELAEYRRGLLSELEAVVSALSKTLDARSRQEWQAIVDQYKHTPHYILTHLLVLESHLFTHNIQLIFNQNNSLLPLFDDGEWMESHYEPNKSFQEIYAEFVHLREQEVEWLRSLNPGAWNRTARHPWWGVRTLQWWVELQLEYSHQHVRELTSLAAI